VELSDVDALVRRAASAEDLVAASSRTSDGYTEVSLVCSGDGISGRTALLFTNGAEGFHLRLDDRYYVREFEYEPDGQRETLRALVGVAAAHLRGKSVPVQATRRLRPDRDSVDVPWNGSTYRALA
jgi:hypothetical protein